MYTKSFALVVLPFLCQSVAAGGYIANLTVYSEDKCAGDSVLDYIDVSTNYCFDTAGSSFGSFTRGSTAKKENLGCNILTYSEKGCPEEAGTCAYFGTGSSYCEQNFSESDIPGEGDCETIPFNSIRIICDDYTG